MRCARVEQQPAGGTLLPFNPDTAQRRQRVAGGKKAGSCNSTAERQTGITEAVDHRPLERGAAASWAHRAAANASSKTAANDRTGDTPARALNLSAAMPCSGIIAAIGFDLADVTLPVAE